MGKNMRIVRTIFMMGTFLVLSSFQTQILEGVVTAVEDGDTITVDIKGTPTVVRLFSIDCPEDGQGFGAKAKQFTTAIAMGKTVKVEKLRLDARGRTIANVILPDGTNLAIHLLEQGLAWHYTVYSDSKELAAIEKKARDQKKGLWVQENPVEPWKYREQQKEQKNN
jgi:endonuclease YncB( thermonuclease family)